MWFPFWQTRNRYSLEELRYLTEQLQKIQTVSETNKDLVIEGLRSIAELVTYGDQNDPSFFEYFVEKNVMGEFVRILKMSRISKVSLQVLQTMSIIIQNLRREDAIHYILSNENTNYLITYSFHFQNDEVLSYYISFLRAVSGKLNKNTISLLAETTNDVVVSFPLYIEAIKFALNDESMIRVAIRSLTLNVYHVGDESINKFVTGKPHSQYFMDIINFFHMQCINFSKLVSRHASNPDSPKIASSIIAAVEELEDSLYYFSDVTSSGVPDIGKLITDNLLHLLIFKLLYPALESCNKEDETMTFNTSLYLLGRILHIVKNKDLASIVSSTLFYPPSCFNIKHQVPLNSDSASHSCVILLGRYNLGASLHDTSANSPPQDPGDSDTTSQKSLREILISKMIDGENLQALGSLLFFSLLLRTKEMEESTLDGLGILPKRKQHKKLLLQSLVGEDLAEDQLFTVGYNNTSKGYVGDGLDVHLKNLEDQYGPLLWQRELQINSKLHRSQVLDALACLVCRIDLPSETRWVGGWLFRQLLPCEDEELTSFHLKLLMDSHRNAAAILLGELKGCWCDLLIVIITLSWKSCKKAIEAPCPPADSKSIILPQKPYNFRGETSIASGMKIYELAKVFVLLRQLLLFTLGRTLTDLPDGHTSRTVPGQSSSVYTLKPGSEMDIVNALPCRIAFERGKERHLLFIAISNGSSGWLVLLEALALKETTGIVRIVAPLAGADPRIDERHPKWLHLRIRPSTLPLESTELDGLAKRKSQILVDGRWTLAFRDEQVCRSAKAMVINEMKTLQREVEAELRPFVEFELDPR